MADPQIQRHLTAIGRAVCSMPVKTAQKKRVIHRASTVFDYGSGRGGDIRCLSKDKVVVDGWDPFYRPTAKKKAADVVHLGFVLNVIENAEERNSVLSDAYRLARKVLVVAVRPKSEEQISMRGHQRYRDGWLVCRSPRVCTFQKFYSQDELKQTVRRVLGREIVLAGPGVGYVWKDEASRRRVEAGGFSGRKR